MSSRNGNSGINDDGGGGGGEDDAGSLSDEMFHMFPNESKQFRTALFVVLAAHCPAAQR